ncbi:DUF397 domain-containing protein [Micromonospora sonneratiae]
MRWRKSTRSGDNGGSCVEVAEVADAVAVRDSKDPSGPAFIFEQCSWSAFVRGVCLGHFEAL